jgi:hypothetical protein
MQRTPLLSRTGPNQGPIRNGATAPRPRLLWHRLAPDLDTSLSPVAPAVSPLRVVHREAAAADCAHRPPLTTFLVVPAPMSRRGIRTRTGHLGPCRRTRNAPRRLSQTEPVLTGSATAPPHHDRAVSGTAWPPISAHIPQPRCAFGVTIVPGPPRGPSGRLRLTPAFSDILVVPAPMSGRGIRTRTGHLGPADAPGTPPADCPRPSQSSPDPQRRHHTTTGPSLAPPGPRSRHTHPSAPLRLRCHHCAGSTPRPQRPTAPDARLYGTPTSSGHQACNGCIVSGRIAGRDRLPHPAGGAAASPPRHSRTGRTEDGVRRLPLPPPVPGP